MRLRHLLDELEVDIAQVRNVCERVDALLFGERAVRPVGETRRLVELDAGYGAHEIVVGDAVAETAYGRGDLGIENVLRHGAGQLHEEFDVLPGGVKDLDHGRVGHQIEERLQA